MAFSVVAHERLAQHTTFHIGGLASHFGVIRSVEDLKEAFHSAKEEGTRVIVLGGGSNVLVDDAGVDAFVLQMAIGGISYHDEEDGSVTVVSGAGVSWDALVQETVGKGLWGIENLSGIPGTVGAAPIQNIGAYGVEVSLVIRWVETYDPVIGKIKRLTPEKCQFEYRESIFKTPIGSSLIITRVALRLIRDGKPMLTYADLKKRAGISDASLPLDMREAVLDIRRKKFPPLSSLGTAGSFFKNPTISNRHAEELKKQFPELPMFERPGRGYKISAAWLIDHVAKMRGAREGKARTYEEQALVLVAEEGASASEVLDLARRVRTRVFEETRVLLEPEVRLIGCAL